MIWNCVRGLSVSEFDNLPYLSISSPVSDVPHLASIDSDFNIPVGQNFRYYSAHDFHSDSEISKCLSDASSFLAIHCNLRSLSANFDKFYHMLTELYFPSSIIGISETQIRTNQDLLYEVNLPGYDFISQPSITAAGGVAFYIKKSFKYTFRKEISTSVIDYEALWVEIMADGQRNIVCGVIYRHPNSNIDNFMDYVNSIMEKIHQENKLCLVMGDFNIDLLKIESHSRSDDFLNMFGSYFFQPYIYYNLLE